ncbi:MAG TPA: citramalate synthase [Solirubrobacteraceae bacterium]|jgi:2-isopropylmalate synthase|nr:citramalate synthase [Solirubrobacteraceae bacterium]
MTPDPQRIELYDATLRDGMGGGGMSLTAQEKLRVVHALDELGVQMIEAGFPSSNPKEQELFALLAGERLRNSEIVAFGMTRRRDAPAERDEGLRILADSFAPICTIVGKASVLHVEKVVRASREENLAMIADSVAFLAGAGKRVLLDAEHFFDGFALDPGYALDCLRAAAGAGAERLVLCDTNGGSLPPQIRTAFAVVREALPGAALGIHCHDDSGCAVANSLVALEAGATQVQGTVNGIGERTGNANLVTIIADLQLKMGVEVLAPERLARLTETAHFVDELLNRAPNPAQPYVGKHAFAHKAGLHAAGVQADSQTFEHVDPALVGNSRDVLVSELSGKAAIAEKAAEASIAGGPGESSDEFAQRVLGRVKELEHEGFQFEAADGSLELLMRKEAGEYEPLFRLESWRVLVEKRADGKVATEATIKVWLGGERFVRTAEGNGPVNALDAALRDAIGELHPHLREIELVNFKVRILDESHGTGAVTRVLIDASDGHEMWGSIGVSENLIAASWDALVDSLEYGMQPGRRPAGAAEARTAPDAGAGALPGRGEA